QCGGGTRVQGGRHGRGAVRPPGGALLLRLEELVEALGADLRRRDVRRRRVRRLEQALESLARQLDADGDEGGSDQGGNGHQLPRARQRVPAARMTSGTGARPDPLRSIVLPQLPGECFIRYDERAGVVPAGSYLSWRRMMTAMRRLWASSGSSGTRSRRSACPTSRSTRPGASPASSMIFRALF